MRMAYRSIAAPPAARPSMPSPKHPWPICVTVNAGASTPKPSLMATRSAVPHAVAAFTRTPLSAGATGFSPSRPRSNRRICRASWKPTKSISWTLTRESATFSRPPRQRGQPARPVKRQRGGRSCRVGTRPRRRCHAVLRWRPDLCLLCQGAHIAHTPLNLSAGIRGAIVKSGVCQVTGRRIRRRPVALLRWVVGHGHRDSVFIAVPASSSLSFSGARMRRQDLAASSASLKASPRKVLRVTQFLVRVVRWRTVAKLDSIGLVVRRWIQCSAGKA